MNESVFDFKGIVEHLSDAIIITKAFPLHGPGPEIVYANRAYCQQNGYADNEAIGKHSNILKFIESDEDAEINLPDALQIKYGPQPIHIKGNDSDKDRWIELTIKPLRNDSGEIVHLLVIERDISEKKKLEKMLQDSSEKDILTSLMNRDAFKEVLQREFSIFSRTKQTYSLLLIDIDRFKNIHENHGEAACNQILSQLANLFEEIFRFYDLTARIGRDKFSVLFRSTSLEQALISSIRFRQSVPNKEFVADGNTIHVTVSIGVSQVLPADTNPVELVERADKALLLAKKEGGDQVQIFKEGVKI